MLSHTTVSKRGIVGKDDNTNEKRTLVAEKKAIEPLKIRQENKSLPERARWTNKIRICRRRRLKGSGQFFLWCGGGGLLLPGPTASSSSSTTNSRQKWNSLNYSLF